GAAIDARAAGDLGDAQLGELGLPRAQDVRLHFHEIADLRRLEERAVRNLDLSGGVRHGPLESISKHQTPEWPNPCPARTVDGSSAPSSHATRITGATTSCAMRIPRVT